MTHPFELPLFDGRIPSGTEMRVSGTSGSPTRAVPLGSKVAVLIAGYVRDVQHPETTDSDGWTTMARRHVVKADTVYLLEEEEGRGLLELERRRALEIREAEAARQAALPGMEDADADGIAELDRYADRLDRQAEGLESLVGDLHDRATTVRGRAEAMREALETADLEDDA